MKTIIIIITYTVCVVNNLFIMEPLSIRKRDLYISFFDISFYVVRSIRNATTSDLWNSMAGP